MKPLLVRVVDCVSKCNSFQSRFNQVNNLLYPNVFLHGRILVKTDMRKVKKQRL